MTIVHLLIFLTTISVMYALAGYTTLTHSSKTNSNFIFPTNAPPAQNSAYNYPSNITEVPEARWIWSGHANDQNCPMKIIIKDEVHITCLSQPVILYAAADNFFTAQFFNQTLYGDSWSSPKSIAINPKSTTCNGKYYFTITAQNRIEGIKKGCEQGNYAAVIYGVIQKNPAVCCDSNAQFYNSSTCQCYPCKTLFVGCLTCSLTQCLTCNTTGNFYLSGTTCLCIQNKYVFNNSICTKCDAFITNCTLCDNSTHCTQCKNGSKLTLLDKCQPCDLGCLSCNQTQCFICDIPKNFLLTNSSCVCPEQYGLLVDQCKLCSSMIYNCKKCQDNTQCQQCFPLFMVNNILQCQACSWKCLVCEFSSGCINCQIGYHIVSGNCISDCGDGILALDSNEQCDDGNIQQDDGCNKFCKIQQNWTCFENNYLSQCYYSSDFRLYVRWIKKQYYRNDLQISLGIKPNHSILNNINFSSSIFIHSYLLPTSYNYNPNGTIFLYYYFQQTLEQKQLSLTFDPSLISFKFYFIPSTSIPITMITNSNIPITHYSDNEYSSAQIMKSCFFISLTISYFFMIISILTIGKVSNVQLLFVWQVLFFSLGDVNKILPIPSGMFSLNIVNGYNIYPQTDNRFVPDRINAIGYQTQFFENFNVNILLVTVGIILPIIIFLFSFIIKKYKTKLQRIAKKMFKQYFLMFVLFSTMSISYSGGLYILYGKQYNFINYLIGIFYIIFMISSFLIAVFFHIDQDGQFHKLLKDEKQSSIYYAVSIIYRFLLGGLMSILNQSVHVVIYAVCLSIFYLIYQISIRPFKSSYHNYRCIIFQSSVIIILGIRLFYRGFRNNYPIQQVTLILQPGYIQIVLILLCLAMNTVIQIYQFIQKFCLKNKIRNPHHQKLVLKTDPGIQTKDSQRTYVPPK